MAIKAPVVREMGRARFTVPRLTSAAAARLMANATTDTAAPNNNPR